MRSSRLASSRPLQCWLRLTSLPLSQPVFAPQVLFSRWLGQLKQGLLHGGDSGKWTHDPAVLEQIPNRACAGAREAEHQLAQT